MLEEEGRKLTPFLLLEASAEGAHTVTTGAAETTTASEATTTTTSVTTAASVATTTAAVAEAVATVRFVSIDREGMPMIARRCEANANHREMERLTLRH